MVESKSSLYWSREELELVLNVYDLRGIFDQLMAITEGYGMGFEPLYEEGESNMFYVVTYNSSVLKDDLTTFNDNESILTKETLW